jgi:KDO2-lipid IV(A) lauroyltransferase
MMRRLRQRAEYGMVVVVRWLIGWLPEAFGRGLGTAIGLAFYAIDRRHRRLAVDQLRAAFPVRPQAECQAIARATFVHFGRSLVALLRFSTLSPDAIKARV